MPLQLRCCQVKLRRPDFLPGRPEKETKRADDDLMVTFENHAGLVLAIPLILGYVFEVIATKSSIRTTQSI